MTDTYKRLAAPALVPVQVSIAAVLTAGGAERLFVKKVTLHNNNATAEVVNIHIVPSGDGPTDTNKIYEIGIDADETVVLEDRFPDVLENADGIEMGTTTASKVSVVFHGLSET